MDLKRLERVTSYSKPTRQFNQTFMQHSSRNKHCWWSISSDYVVISLWSPFNRWQLWSNASMGLLRTRPEAVISVTDRHVMGHHDQVRFCRPQQRIWRLKSWYPSSIVSVLTSSPIWLLMPLCFISSNDRRGGSDVVFGTLLSDRADWGVGGSVSQLLGHPCPSEISRIWYHF